MAKVLTANRLSDGAVVFWTADREWSSDYRESCLVPDSDISEAEEAGREAEQNRIVVGAYLIDAEAGDDGEIVFKKFRERIRAGGPTVLYGEPAVQGKAA
jgi:hypothetical protein